MMSMLFNYFIADNIFYPIKKLPENTAIFSKNSVIQDFSGIKKFREQREDKMNRVLRTMQSRKIIEYSSGEGKICALKNMYVFFKDYTYLLKFY